MNVLQQLRHLFSSLGGAIATVWRFYRDGFRAMTVGRYLWAMIIIKIVILMAVFRLLLLPDRLGDYDTDADRARAVRSALTTPR